MLKICSKPGLLRSLFAPLCIGLFVMMAGIIGDFVIELAEPEMVPMFRFLVYMSCSLWMLWVVWHVWGMRVPSLYWILSLATIRLFILSSPG